MHLRQRHVIGVLAGGALCANFAFSSTAAVAASGGVSPADASINGDTVSTNISVSEDGGVRHGVTRDPSYLGPSCWLAPFGGDGQTPVPTYTPDEFAAYGDSIIAGGSGAGAGPVTSENAYEMQSIYQTGNPATNGVVRLINPPYNEGLNGSWDWIVCSINYTYQNIADLTAELGVNNDYESWFWLNDGNPPNGAPTISPDVLAEYAEANMTVSDQWPDTSPSFTAAKQTVNLPTEVTNAAGANGYHEYTATASLTVDPDDFSEVTATPKDIVISSSALTQTVTCDFDADGALKAGCVLNFDKATAPNAKVTVSATVNWTVTWNEDPGDNGWPKNLPVNLAVPVTVQEIQTVVNGN